MNAEETPQARPRLRDLFIQVFSDQEIVPAGMYCAYNAFAGLILIMAALAFWATPSNRDAATAGPVCAVVGPILLAGAPLAFFRPRLTLRLLALQGTLIVLVALWLFIDALRAALSPAPLVSFKYIPGPLLIAVTYGGLQIASFGPWRTHARRVRLAGFVVGLAAEIALAAALVAHLARSL